MQVIENTQSRRFALKSLLTTAAASVAGLFGVAQAQAPGTRSERRTSTDDRPADRPAPLFSGHVVHGGLVYVAGKGEHGEGDISVHTKSVLDQIEAELKRAGSSMEKVLKVNVYLHDIKDYSGMNNAYRGRFGNRPPVRTTVACYGGIPGSSLVEIDCIASL